MIKQLLTLVIATCVLNLAPTAVASAQVAQDDQHIRHVKLFVNNIGLGNRDNVKVSLTSKTGTLNGHITKIGDNDFVVTNKKGVDTTIAFTDVKDIKRDRISPWLIGGIVVAAIFGAALICYAAGGCVE